MTNPKFAKRSLIFSAIALVLSAAMLFGATFAWFTDGVTNVRNQIVAGNLDVELYHSSSATGNAYAPVESATELFLNANGEQILWEPGANSVENFMIKNEGTVSLKYEFAVTNYDSNSVTVNGVEKTLADVLNTEVGEKSGNMKFFTISGTLEAGEAVVIPVNVVWTPSANDNDYNLKDELNINADGIEGTDDDDQYGTSDGKYLWIDLGIKLVATQFTSEFDSNGNDYDEDATYITEVNTVEELQMALSLEKECGNIILSDDIVLEDTLVINENTVAKLNLNGNTLTGSILAPNADLTVENGTIKNTDASVSAIEITSGKLTLNNMSIESARHAVRVDGDVEVTINGGDYKASGVKGKTQHALNVSGNAIVNIYGGNFVGPKSTASDSGSAVNVQTGSTVNIYGGNFSGGKRNTLSGSNLTVYGGTFDQDPAKYVAAGYTVVNTNGKYAVVMTVETLEAALNAGKTVVMNGDLTVTESLDIEKNVTAVLDLNGYTITGSDSSTKSYGLININEGANLTINDSVGTGKIVLKATNDRDWNAYSSVISNQRGYLTVNGGTIEHLGGTDMAYGIDNLTNGKNTYAETVINGGTVKSTYRAIRQFLNGIEAQNILTINGGTIEGTNKSVWMHDPSANANSGSLTISENAKLKGDVYLFVTAGSTEWPVNVSIANGALVGESTVISGNVPAGYAVVNNGTAWSVANNSVTVKSAEELQNAVNVATENTTIVFGADITGNVTVTQKVNLTIVGNGYKFNGVMTVFGNGNQSGADTLAIKNINFVAANGADSCIVSPDRAVNNKYSYAHNVTVENCTFTDPDGVINCAAIRHEDGGDKNWTVTGCTVDSTMHSLLQVNNVAGKLTIIDCTVESKNGVNLNSCTNVEITGCNFNVKGYAVRFGVDKGGNIDEAKTFVVADSKLKAACNDGDAVIIFRADAVKATLTLTNTTVEGTLKVKGNTDATTIIGLN